MIKLSYQTVTLSRQRPLRISRGIKGDTVNFWVKLVSDNIEGWGAACPFSTGMHAESAAEIEQALNQIASLIYDCNPLERQRINNRVRSHFKSLPIAAAAALDTALWDWLGKRINLPLWQLWGLDLSLIPPTSVTVGIEEPETAAMIAGNWLSGTMSAEHLYPEQKKNRFKYLKVKLGCEQGLDADKARLKAVLREAAGSDTGIMVDANAGWNLREALDMCHWLKDKKVILVEQPLQVTATDDWQRLHEASPLPIFADESCFSTRDVFRLADSVDGVVIKMMKCGGLSEALEIIAVARSRGLRVMLGCYGETALANSAMAQLSPLVDYVDLDSHFNLRNDPFQGAVVSEGKLIPDNSAGIGVVLKNAQ